MPTLDELRRDRQAAENRIDLIDAAILALENLDGLTVEPTANRHGPREWIADDPYPGDGIWAHDRDGDWVHTGPNGSRTMSCPDGSRDYVYVLGEGEHWNAHVGNYGPIVEYVPA